MSTRIGKIGRLSKDRRNELGQRIEDGEPGTEIVYWLNGLPDVQKILQEHFAGRAISEQNLSDWKQGGHVEWLRREEAREAALRLTERADDLDEAVREVNLSDRFATVFSAEMTRLALALLEEESDPEKKWKRLCEIHRELSRLRRDDHRAVRTAIWQERWDWEVAREEVAEAQREKQAHKERMMNRLFEGKDKEINAELFGGGKAGRRRAEMLYRLKCDLPLGDVLDGTWSEKAEAARAREKAGSLAGVGKSTAKAEKSGLIKPNKGEKTGDAVELKGTKCNTRARRPRSDGQGAETVRQEESAVPATPMVPSNAAGGEGAAPGRDAATSPMVSMGQTGETPVPLLPAETHVSDPKKEAHNRWFRMNRGAEPFDQEALEKLYAAIPPKER